MNDADPDTHVARLIANDPVGVVAGYRRKYGIPPQTRVDPAMIALHWEVERRGTKSMLQSSPENRAEVAERAYSELYERCPWLNQPSKEAADPAIEFGFLLPVFGKARSIYEIGSGGGHLIRWLAQRGFACVATEITAERGRKIVAEGSNLSWHPTDGVNITRFEERASYDIALSVQVLEHIHPADVPRHFAEIHAIVAPFGKYVFITPHPYAGPDDLSAVFGLAKPACHHLKEWRYRELVPLLKAAGFRDIRAIYTLPLSLRRRASALNQGLESRTYLALLCLCETLLDAFPPIAGRLGAKLLNATTLIRSDVQISARK